MSEDEKYRFYIIEEKESDLFVSPEYENHCGHEILTALVTTFIGEAKIFYEKDMAESYAIKLIKKDKIDYSVGDLEINEYKATKVGEDDEP